LGEHDRLLGRRVLRHLDRQLGRRLVPFGGPRLADGVGAGREVGQVEPPVVALVADLLARRPAVFELQGDAGRGQRFAGGVLDEEDQRAEPPLELDVDRRGLVAGNRHRLRLGCGERLGHLGEADLGRADRDLGEADRAGGRVGVAGAVVADGARRLGADEFGAEADRVAGGVGQPDIDRAEAGRGLERDLRLGARLDRDGLLDWVGRRGVVRGRRLADGVVAGRQVGELDEAVAVIVAAWVARRAGDVLTGDVVAGAGHGIAGGVLGADDQGAGRRPFPFEGEGDLGHLLGFDRHLLGARDDDGRGELRQDEPVVAGGHALDQHAVRRRVAIGRGVVADGVPGTAPFRESTQKPPSMPWPRSTVTRMVPVGAGSKANVTVAVSPAATVASCASPPPEKPTGARPTETA
jgi:hypothetical protein